MAVDQQMQRNLSTLRKVAEGNNSGYARPEVLEEERRQKRTGNARPDWATTPCIVCKERLAIHPDAPVCLHCFRLILSEYTPDRIKRIEELDAWLEESFTGLQERVADLETRLDTLLVNLAAQEATEEGTDDA